MTESGVSLQREELQSHLLDDETLEYVEEKFPGVVRLRLSRRTRAVIALRIKGHKQERLLIYHLPDDESIECPLAIEGRYLEVIKRSTPDLLQFATHRACEAMLALRNGHKERVQKVRKAKATRELQKADT